MLRSNMTSNNMYRVGDFVFFEASASAPYQIRKIEELNKTSSGAVEAKVLCFYRRRDLVSSLVQLANAHQKEVIKNLEETFSEDQLHQLRHRELFLSRHLEVLPATHIRGKCHVTLHNEAEPYLSYLNTNEAFFFQVVYDPINKTLQADKGAIKIGEEYQAKVGDIADYPVYPVQCENEELLWSPTDKLLPNELDTYLVMAKSLATLARAYYPPSALRQPNLVMSAAAASRDATIQHAFNTLQLANHDVTKALHCLAPNGLPVVKLDEMEEWSISEGNLFEEALEKYGKCFYDIHSDFLPWKPPKSLVAFYYMWKTTDHYVQQKRMKAMEAEHKLKQVYIPNYNKPNPAVLYTSANGTVDENVASLCEGCGVSTSSQWYALGPPSCLFKVCSSCWSYWKRYGDLKSSSLADQLASQTMISRCPFKSCEEEFEDKSFLASHLETRHSQQEKQHDNGQIASIKSVDMLDNYISSNNQSTPAFNQPNQFKLTPTLSPSIDNSKLASIKARIGINFYFQSTVSLQFARRLCAKQLTKPNVQARRPFVECPMPLESLYENSKDLLKNLSSKGVDYLWKLCSHECDKTELTSRQEAANRLNTLASNLHTKKTDISTKMSAENDISDGSVADSVEANLVMDLALDTRSSSVESEKMETESKPVVPLVSTGKRLNDNNSSLIEQTIKKARCTDSPIQFNASSPCQPSPLCEATRETGFGAGVPGTETLMFLAAESFRHQRRKLITPSALHRLCRRPWSDCMHPLNLNAQVKSSDITEEVNGTALSAFSDDAQSPTDV